MQRAAGKRFVGFPDPSHDQRGKCTEEWKNPEFLIFPPLESPATCAVMQSGSGWEKSADDRQNLSFGGNYALI